MNQRKPLFKERKNNLSQQFPLLSKHSDTVYPHKDKRSFIKENTMALHFPNTIHCTHKETKRMGGATGSPGRSHSGLIKSWAEEPALSCPRWSCLGTGRQSKKKTKSPRGAMATELKIAFIKLWRWLGGWSACCISTEIWVQSLHP